MSSPQQIHPQPMRLLWEGVAAVLRQGRTCRLTVELSAAAAAGWTWLSILQAFAPTRYQAAFQHTQLCSLPVLKYAKDKIRARGNWQARYFVQHISTRTVPLHKLAVNMLHPGKGVVALGIICVDVLPRRKNKHVRVKGMGLKRGAELPCRQWRNRMKHAQGLDKPSIEEDPASVSRMNVVFLGVATKNLMCELERLRTGALAESPTLRNDCSGRLGDGCVALRTQLGNQCCLANARSTSDENSGHCFGG